MLNKKYKLLQYFVYQQKFIMEQTNADFRSAT